MCGGGGGTSISNTRICGLGGLETLFEEHHLF